MFFFRIIDITPHAFSISLCVVNAELCRTHSFYGGFIGIIFVVIDSAGTCYDELYFWLASLLMTDFIKFDNSIIRADSTIRTARYDSIICTWLSVFLFFLFVIWRESAPVKPECHRTVVW